MRYRELFPDMVKEGGILEDEASDRRWRYHKSLVKRASTPIRSKSPGLSDETVDAIINRPRPENEKSTTRADQ